MTFPPNAVSGSPSSQRLAWLVGTATLSRLFLNTARRFVYPFAPTLSRGLGVPITAITSLIALNQAAGLLSPLFGPLGDRWGYRIMMISGLGMLAVGMTATGIFPIYATLALAVLLAGLGKSLYDPALQAYIGENVAYHRRGMVMGIIEFSWAGSTLVGIPLIGLLIGRVGWQSPFLILGGLAAVSAVSLSLIFPKTRRRQAGPRTGYAAAWRLLRSEPAAIGALGFSFCMAMANDNLFVSYGLWLESRFALTVVALGTATTVIGLAELVGEGLTATIADRLGLKRSIFTGLILTVLSYGLLPLLGQSLLLGLVGLFFVFLAFEFTIVTSFPLFTELIPQARGAMMSALLAAAGLGRMTGALLGGPVWLAGGITAIGLTSAGITSLALLSLGWGLQHWSDINDKG